MCGIAGIVDPLGHQPDETNRRLAQNMTRRLRHRGPDDHGLWQQDNVTLAHQRLSIVDLSAAGHQPMISADGRWVLSYNGEIYNTEQLRSQLKHSIWRGTSDSEVLLQAIAELGVSAAVEQLVGMFAFAVYDTQQRQLWLCRDRLGIKPLYYGWVGERLVFASELHAFAECREHLSINPAAVTTFLRHSFIPAPASIYKEIQKLTPGTLLCIHTARGADQTSAAEVYWSLKDHVGIDPDADLDTTQHQLLALLRDAVKDRLVADVPLGAFLSGGYDSSLICALMQEQADTAVRTFTIGFDDPRYNEAEHASKVAQHLGCLHTELYVSEQDMLDSVAQLPRLCDEPFADASILPTFLVSQLARSAVTVALSGDGGDELFWGYHRYHTAEQLWRRVQNVPLTARKVASHVLQHPFTQTITRPFPGGDLGGRQGPLNQKLRTAGELLASPDQATLYQGLMSHWRSPHEVCRSAAELETAYNDSSHWSRGFPSLQRMAIQDTLTYLPDAILTKVDRASMLVSLEARVPLLDHRVVEFVSHLPAELRRQPGAPKYLLKRILNQYVPAAITDRPKRGFGVPLDTWLRGPLREWAEQLLDKNTITDQGLLHPQPIQQLWQAHLSGKVNNSARLWSVLMLQAWLQQQRA